MPCNGGYQYTRCDCGEYEEIIDKLIQHLCYACAESMRLGFYKDLVAGSPALDAWWIEHQKQDRKRVFEKMVAEFKRYQGVTVDEMAEYYITRAKEAHPLSNWHEEWMHDMAQKALDQVQAERLVNKEEDAFARAIEKLEPDEREALKKGMFEL